MLIELKSALQHYFPLYASDVYGWVIDPLRISETIIALSTEAEEQVVNFKNDKYVQSTFPKRARMSFEF